MRWQEAGGINPGYAYDTGLPVPASFQPPACLTPNDGNADRDLTITTGVVSFLAVMISLSDH